MALPRLEIFTGEGTGEDRVDVIVTDLADFESIKLNSYEQGYLAGWEDGAAAQSAEQDQAREDLLRKLQQLSFTWEEARAHILSNLQPLLHQLVTVMLPEMMRDSLALWILGELLPKAEDQVSKPPVLRLSPDDRPHLEDLFAAFPHYPFTWEEDASLPSGHIQLSLGAAGNRQETQIDLASCLATLKRLVRDHFTQEGSDG